MQRSKIQNARLLMQFLFTAHFSLQTAALCCSMFIISPQSILIWNRLRNFRTGIVIPSSWAGLITINKNTGRPVFYFKTISRRYITAHFFHRGAVCVKKEPFVHRLVESSHHRLAVYALLLSTDAGDLVFFSLR